MLRILQTHRIRPIASSQNDAWSWYLSKEKGGTKMSRFGALPIFLLLFVNYIIHVHAERRIVCALGASLTNLYLQQIKHKTKAAK
jgi:hypothetical protein